MNQATATMQNYVQTQSLIYNSLVKQLVTRLVVIRHDSEALLEVLTDFFADNTLPLHDFTLSKNAYSRTILYREETGFEIMVARWDKYATTPIHGHPDFALYYVIAGRLKETVYSKVKGTVVEDHATIYETGDFTCNHGIEGRFDNFIHKITAAAESLSLHIYSDDALKGEVFGGALH